MFRPARPGSPLRRLSALPAGTHVRLWFGAIFIRYVKRWMQAGFIGEPIGPKALLRLNGGAFPTVLVSAAGTPHGDAW